MGVDAAESLKRLEDICRERGWQSQVSGPPYLRCCCNISDHPTAEQIFEAVQERSPQISRRTVYRVLDTLAELLTLA